MKKLLLALCMLGITQYSWGQELLSTEHIMGMVSAVGLKNSKETADYLKELLQD